jgi:hypothetical protein
MNTYYGQNKYEQDLRIAYARGGMADGRNKARMRQAMKQCSCLVFHEIMSYMLTLKA